LNWDLLGFFSFIFSLTWGVYSLPNKGVKQKYNSQ
jgi:hypothetical protein